MKQCLLTWIRRAACVAPLALIVTAAAAQLTTDPAYIGGRTAWQQRLWTETINRLRPLIEPANRANFEVDFWLGTSLCRTQFRVAQGANILDWALSFRSMPEEARYVFAKERGDCLSALKGSVVASSNPGDPGRDGNAVATVSGTPKLYIQGGSEGNLALSPLRVVTPKPISELEARLVMRDDPQTATKMLQALTPSARTAVSRYAALSSVSPSLGKKELETLGARIDDFVEFMRVAYGLEAPSTYITVHIVPDIARLKATALRLHGMRANDYTLGYSFANDRAIVAVLTTTAAGTLLHEVSHVLVHETFGSVPQWLDEGMASLYETSTAVSGAYFGEPNWRSPVFAQLRPRLSGISLREVITAPWFSDEPVVHQKLGETIYDPEQQAYLLAYARMFSLYLQETGNLRNVFQTFKARTVPDTYVPARQYAVKLLETALGGRSLSAIESDFLAWAPKAYDRNTRFYASRDRAQAIRKELPGLFRDERLMPDGNVERENFGVKR
jgi:hypothetical protein